MIGWCIPLSLHPQNKTSSNIGKLIRFSILRMRHILIYLTSSVIRSNTEYWIPFWSSHPSENHQSGVQTRAFKAIRVCAYYVIWEIAEGTEEEEEKKTDVWLPISVLKHGIRLTISQAIVKTSTSCNREAEFALM